MTPIDILGLVVLCVPLGLVIYAAYSANRELQEMKSWWADYNARLDEVNARLQQGSLEPLPSGRPESGEVAKEPRAEGDMSSLEDRDNLVFLNTPNEEQR